ncbi:uncharacterized protein BP5553_07400 [Venustampulla echinocandica]|uniref:Uncharacterized protein n=1 Tax=Venustampulla echinocandica TaxID=2656787 RepID=A0A370TJD5_9HELO|nr:uncharacterized protein BP5553_07400 [Venustampulla echinocandica]RDL35469.1 hypothetical protein BP5553_07400 [Venustampulla echinocandica]
MSQQAGPSHPLLSSNDEEPHGLSGLESDSDLWYDHQLLLSWMQNRNASPQSEMEPPPEIPDSLKGTADPNSPVAVDFASLFKEDVEYNPAYMPFIDSLPPDGTDKDKVRLWLRTWFEFSDIFASDIGVDKFLDTIPLTGRELIIAKSYPLWSYLQSGNEICHDGKIYDLEIIYGFFGDIQRARVVSAIKRGVPRAQEAYRESMIVKRIIKATNTKRDAEKLSESLATMSLEEKDEKRSEIPQEAPYGQLPWLSNRSNTMFKDKSSGLGNLATNAGFESEVQKPKDKPNGFGTMIMNASTHAAEVVGLKGKDKPPKADQAPKTKMSKAERKHARTRQHLQGRNKKMPGKVKLEHLEEDG